jgi:arginyl-tRNA synthetase
MLLQNFVCEYPKNKEHGDVATNIAMVLAKHYKVSPMELAPMFANKINTLDFVKSTSIASPGFINISIKPDLLNKMLISIYKSTELPNYGNGEKINIEYVSANPTGPLHVGHLRGAVYGDVLASLLVNTGFNVTKEYYINDAGNQINILAKSVYIRYLQLLGKKIEVPEGCYPAAYIIEIAEEIVKKYGKTLEETDSVFKEYAVHYNMEWIKKTLKKLKIQHDIFASEKEIVNSNAIKEAFTELEAKNLIYKGIPPKPHKVDEEDWVPVEQTLFRASLFGDTDDRVVQKADGSYTYCVPDMIYQRNKIMRGFNKLIMVLGADHLGYVTRLQSMTKALAKTENFNLDIKICQIVKFLNNGEAFKMSKRAGTFVTVDDILESVHPDILRFTMLIKKNDVHMDFDVEKVKEQTKENPIFYIQYAYSRINSVLRKSHIKTTDFSIGIGNEKFHDLVMKILEFPAILQVSVKNYEPHHLAFYLYSLSASLHGIWSLGNTDDDYRFISEDNTQHNQESINILSTAKKIFDYTYNIFNIEALTSM